MSEQDKVSEGSKDRSEPDRFARERRSSPLTGQLVLAVGFLLILIAAIFTVLIPEIQDDAEDEEQGQQSSAPAATDEPPGPPEGGDPAAPSP